MSKTMVLMICSLAWAKTVRQDERHTFAVRQEIDESENDELETVLNEAVTSPTLSVENCSSSGFCEKVHAEAERSLLQEGNFLPWTVADKTSCLESYTNYPAMWVTAKGASKDTNE